MQEIADSLNISRVTVWKALNNKPGVAEETAEKIRRRANELRGIPTGPAASLGVGYSHEVQNVSLVVSRADSSVFWTKIVDQIASELSKLNINLIYTPMDMEQINSRSLSSIIQNSESQGMIIINTYDKQIVTALSKLQLPKVFLDTVPSIPTNELNGDILLLEGVKTVESITDRLIQQGAERIGFIGDIQYSKTNLLRWEGYLSSLRKNNLSLDKELCLTGPLGGNTYKQEITAFLGDIDKTPDAFVCANDFIASIVISYFIQKDYSIPDDIIVSGYDDCPEFFTEDYAFPTVHVQNEMLGKRLVRQLLFRIENPDADYEEIYIYPKIYFRK